jgi:hypothetical protein
VRLDRELREFTRADPEPTSTLTTSTDDTLSTPTRTRTPQHVIETRRRETTRHDIEDYEDESTTIPES